MSYWNIPRKCSVCQCCGRCDNEYELEIGDISGDYSPMMSSLMMRDCDKPKPMGEIIKSVFGNQ